LCCCWVPLLFRLLFDCWAECIVLFRVHAEANSMSKSITGWPSEV
jgi:hypothetical protein